MEPVRVFAAKQNRRSKVPHVNGALGSLISFRSTQVCPPIPSLSISHVQVSPQVPKGIQCSPSARALTRVLTRPSRKTTAPRSSRSSGMATPVSPSTWSTRLSLLSLMPSRIPMLLTTERCSSVSPPCLESVARPLTSHLSLQLEQMLVQLSRMPKGKIQTRVERGAVEMCTSRLPSFMFPGS